MIDVLIWTSVIYWIVWFVRMAWLNCECLATLSVAASRALW